MAQDSRMANKWPMVLLLYLIYAVAFFSLIALFMGYLAVIYGQRLFNFAVDCVLGVLE
jgi:hypothetical protein